MKNTNLTKTTKLAAILAVAAMDVLAADPAKTEENAEANRKRIVISIPDRKLVLFQGERVLRVYDVAVGKSSTPTPQGKFAIVNHVQHPTWYGPKGQVVAPGK